MMPDRITLYRARARRCGIWPVARAMLKAGYSVWQARWVLLNTTEDYPVLTRVARCVI